MGKNIKELFDFIEKSPSTFHVIENVEQRLEEEGFKKVETITSISSEMGDKYYLTLNQSTLVAVRLPKKKAKGFHVITSHSDAPTFKLKWNPEIPFEGKYTSLNVEAYGGMLMAPWFDRPLSIAGRVVLDQNGTMKEEIFDFDKDCVSIVNPAIHLNRDANKGTELKIAKDMIPLWAGNQSEESFIEAIAKKMEIDKKDILDWDLFLYNRMRGREWGANEEFISAPKLDDLENVYASTKAFLEEEPMEYINVLAVLDNEETGSMTKQGAASSYLSDILKGVAKIQKEIEYDELLEDSFMLSADNGHAIHPNYPEKHDKTNRPYLNGGVLIKYSGNQKYTTDARTGGFVKMLCKQNQIPYQAFFNHSDIPGGSTLGNIATTHLTIKAADIGVAQLAMHSPYETGGSKDVEYLIQLMKAFYGL